MPFAVIHQGDCHVFINMTWQRTGLSRQHGAWQRGVGVIAATGAGCHRPLRLVMLALRCAIGGTAVASPELAGRIAAERPAACADYRFLFLSLYRAELWTDAAEMPGETFGLSLIYRRSFSRDDLISNSISEMARISGRPEADFDVARAELDEAFQDVVSGDRYTAWRSGPGSVEFFLNGAPTGTLSRDGDLFLDIWLGPQSRDLKRRNILLSGRCDG